MLTKSKRSNILAVLLVIGQLLLTASATGEGSASMFSQSGHRKPCDKQKPKNQQVDGMLGFIKPLQLARSSRQLETNTDAYFRKRPAVAMRQTKKPRESDQDAKLKIIGGERYASGKSKKSRESGLKLPSSVTAEDMGASYSLTQRVRDRLSTIDVQDAAVITTYMCTQVAISELFIHVSLLLHLENETNFASNPSLARYVALPVILIPMIAADPFAPGVPNTMSSAAFVGTIVSLSSLGAGFGKIINGFVCQAIGGRASGTVYLLGLSFFSLLLSSTYSIHGYAIAGMEFCASMMWTAMSVLMANRYEGNAKKFTAGIMALSLGSTIGTLIAKIVGGALLSQFHWRQVCLLSAAAAALGSAILYFVGGKQDQETSSNTSRAATDLPKTPAAKTAGPSLGSIMASISRVVGNPMFFAISLAHFTAFIVRSSDKVLGTFILDATDLPSKCMSFVTFDVMPGTLHLILTFDIIFV